MKKINFYLLLVGLLFWGILANDLRFLYCQEKTTAHTDTSKKAVKKLPPATEPPRLQLPEVLIYGTDRSLRVSGDKLNRSREEVKLIAPSIDYQSEGQHRRLQNHKGYFQFSKEKIKSRTAFKLDVGSFQQFEINASHWKQNENYNYGIGANYERSNGQYENSQYLQAGLKSQLGMRLSSGFIVAGNTDFQLFDYGLYGAETSGLKRELKKGDIKIESQWSPAADQSATVSIYYQQNNYRDRAEQYQSELARRDIGLVATYQTRLRTIPLFVRGSYDYQKLDITDDEIVRSQKYLRLKSWTSVKINRYFRVKPGVLFENLDLAALYSAGQFSPELEIIATPTSHLGILLKGSRGFEPMNYAGLSQKNPFISYQVDFIPARKELELKFGVEYNPISGVSLIGEFIQQNWSDYAFWARNVRSGLFVLNSLDKVNLTNINFQAQWRPRSDLKLDTGLQLYFPSVPDQSLQSGKIRVPYLEKFRIPITIEYSITDKIQSGLTLLWIGARYTEFDADHTLGSFGLLNAHVKSHIYKSISFFIGGNNLLNQKYEFWEKYPGMGAYFEAGLKGNW